MNNILKITSVLIIVLYVISNKTYAQHVVEASEVDFKNGVLVKYKGSFKDIIIPSSFDGIPLERIGYQAFLNTDIEKVVISAGIKYLEEHSLSNNPISDLKLNEGLLKIGRAAFANCDFDSLNIPQSVEFIGDDAFFGCNLKKMSFSEPNSIKYIGEKAFCSAMCDIIFPKNSNEGFKKYINEDNFEFSEHDTIDVWKTYWSVLPNHTILESEIELVDGDITEYYGTYTDITIPNTIGSNSILKIGHNVFQEKGLLKVVFETGIEIIETGAFWGNFLSSISLPESMKYVGDFAFACNKLTRIEVNYPTIDFGIGIFNLNQIKEINGNPTNGLFYQNSNAITDSLIIISYGNNIANVDFIPKNVKVIEEDAFSNLLSYTYYEFINKIILPDSLIRIGRCAFFGNDIKKLVLPESLTEIGVSAFSYNNIDTILIPGNIEKIESSAFSENDSLRSVSFKANSILKQFERNVFGNTMIDTLFLPSPLTPRGYEQFLGWYKNDDTIAMDMPLLNCNNNYNQPSLNAKFSIIYYNIFYENVGTLNDTLNPTSYTVEDQIYLLHSPYDSTGYNFAGWYTDSLLTDSVGVGFLSRGSIGDTILYAKWEPELVDIKSKEANLINVYPNPTKDILFIEYETIPYNITVYNSLGLRLIDEIIYTKKSEINLTNFHQGIYFISTQTKNKRSTVKIVKK